MFHKNDYVNYTTQGICKIEDIQLLKFGRRREGCRYYILHPIYQAGMNIFVPTDSAQLLRRMRPIPSPQEIDRIIDETEGRALPWPGDRKQRSAHFQDILARRDERELLLLVNCLTLRAQEDGKGLSSSDEYVLKRAKAMVEQEFSFALNIPPQDVGTYIKTRLQTVQTSHTSQKEEVS